MGDAFLDNYALERQSGDYDFFKQAVFQLGDSQVTLLDTPGHVDFSGDGSGRPGAGLCGFGSHGADGAGTHPHALESACATGFRHSYLSHKMISRGRTRCADSKR